MIEFSEAKRIRKSFGKIPEVIDTPNLINLQKRSYDDFLQINIEPKQRQDRGLQAALKSIFPIEDYAGKITCEFVSYSFDKPKYTIAESRRRGVTYAAAMRAVLRLVIWDVDEELDNRSIRDIKEQEVYMGDIPLMTPNGTFVVNGTERVIVSQMHRSPGVFFDSDSGKSNVSGKVIYNCRIIPYRGSWLDFEFDNKDVVYVRIDRKRKIPATTLLMCLDDDVTHEKRESGHEFAPYEARGLSKQDILHLFYDVVEYGQVDNGWKVPFDVTHFKGTRVKHDLVNADTGEVVLKQNDKVTPRLANKLTQDGGLKNYLADVDAIFGRYLAYDIIDDSNGIVLVEAGDEITEDNIDLISQNCAGMIPTLNIDNIYKGSHIRDTFVVDKNNSREEALLDIYRVMRPGEPVTLEATEELLEGLFFDPERYDLSDVGRVKINAKFQLDCSDEVRTLRRQDMVEALRYLLNLRDGRGQVDDIDHLGNRRVRSVGELMENQYRLGLVRMQRAVKERMSAVDLNVVVPQDMVNSKPISAAIRDFFTTSQLSQFMDQTNPLSEITHKRRLSALGPGGLTRDRAGFEVRDVHTTHYGRICPVETPEGPNIGLINSLATYARVNKYGFIESPYRKVVAGVVSNEVDYLTAIEEARYIIAQANSELDDDNNLTGDFIPCRSAGDLVMAQPKEIDYIDVTPKQVVSVASALIPFLENDDANRALMGSNMQRQAVPLLQADAPMVGTGMERAVARDSGALIKALHGGIVDSVDALRIVVRINDDEAGGTTGVDIYNLRHYERSNQSTCITQRAIVNVGDKINKGDVLADGPSTDMGELALGKNVLCAFMPWNGYNFEDSILISERIVRDDVYTSIHIEEYEVLSRDTKLGQEEITRDIPNIGEEFLRNIDESGIIHIGSNVNPGDILVGKVTPKGESPMTPEEKLLRSIFGEKIVDVRDSSLRMPAGAGGTVVDVQVFSRTGVEKDQRTLMLEQQEIVQFAKERDTEKRIIQQSYASRLKGILIGQTVLKGITGKCQAGDVLDEAKLSAISSFMWDKIVVEDASVVNKVNTMAEDYHSRVKEIELVFDDRVEKLQRGDDLAPGVMKMVKVFVAVKRKLQPGDKMAGRHGNKGVVSRIAKLEDMPHLEDGTPVDIVLNPLGVPSRMNVGQILETHLGWAASGISSQIRQAVDQYQADNDKLTELKSKLVEHYGDDEKINSLSDNALVELATNLGHKVTFATPVFDGAREEDIIACLQKSGFDSSGQATLIDGRTGDRFDRQVTVGYIYMLKLHHLVDDKIHARSVGPYSLVTQQPLGGKAQFGGQRFGEMEVWALQAYGAAHILQEMLTVKSDDVIGRAKVYEAIIRNSNDFQAGIPESFNVLMKEIRSLCINIDVRQDHNNDDELADGDVGGYFNAPTSDPDSF